MFLLPWMTTENAKKTKPNTFDNAIFVYGFLGIF